MRKITKAAVWAAALVAAGIVPALAAPLTIDLEGDAQRTTVDYACKSGPDAAPTPLGVEYINLPHNNLAVLPIDGHPTVFVDTVAAAGAKYAAGRWIWWTRGRRGTLRDVIQNDPKKDVICELKR
ncbi:MliC family protein [Aurantimonas sp. VKM B-3413]|uniref:MliC family protein n=1 Tax=Aurantimonas sp. VKM B-3413 TaxID=2779401 RepID=UPI001E4B47DE|nr:MliC family protein [Aurantimonas sp. VKM B-3413]MCB8839016.1 MliC family protein [Aurantimonas sp. VKM B-3413]